MNPDTQQLEYLELVLMPDIARPLHAQRGDPLPCFGGLEFEKCAGS